MKKFLTFVLLFILSTEFVLAYSMNVYNKQGKLVGVAVKNGDKVELYDLKGNKITPKETLYSPPGVPVKDLNISTKYKVEYYQYEK